MDSLYLYPQVEKSFSVSISFYPISDVELNGSGNISVKLSSLESDNVDITMNDGDCELYKAKVRIHSTHMYMYMYLWNLISEHCSFT